MIKKHKRIKILLMLMMAVTVLSGCSSGSTTSKPTGFPYGFIYNYLAVPGQSIMAFIAKFVGGYGWAVIVLTAIVRLILLPLMTNQMKKSTIQQEKISLIRPQLQKIQKLQKSAKTQEESMKVSQAMMKLYRENDISMTGGIGCLPILIQLPVFAALYEAIRYSNELSKTVFFGIQLGKPNLLLAILAAASYIIQAWLSSKGLPQEQSKMMKPMLLISPIMILVISMTAPAGLGLYFFVGGIFACIQTVIINLYRPKIKREIAEQAKNNPIKDVLADLDIDSDDVDSNDDSKSDHKNNISSDQMDQKNRQRNAGKQQKR